MSRVGKQPIPVPSGTSITFADGQMTVTGPKGTLYVPMLEGVEVAVSDGQAVITRSDDSKAPEHGLIRALLSNAVTGVATGWSKDLELHGVGLRAALAGSTLTLNLGFSHPVTFVAPAGIAFQVVKNVITVSGIDRQLVGETSAKIRQFKEPEPYKGKGIRYSTEIVRRKAGKTGGKK
jgi:large subunit ribosomal protein L6